MVGVADGAEVAAEDCEAKEDSEKGRAGCDDEEDEEGIDGMDEAVVLVCRGWGGAKIGGLDTFGLVILTG